MLGSDDFCSTRIISHLRDESGDEELSVLPRHTKVIVTGNNRTKSVLLGLQGVVKKAVGLGGWHWLVLKNGIEVKLQRNALSVLEHPTGNEVDDDMDVDSGSGSDGEKDLDFSSGSEFLKPRKPRAQSMKPMIQSAAMKYPSSSSYKDIQSSLINVPKPKVDLTKLGTDSLWRYCSHYNIVGINDHSSREEMLNAVQQHFVSQQPLDETRVLADFTQAVKRVESGSPKE